MFADHKKEIKDICDKVEVEGKNQPSTQLRFTAYKAIAKHTYGKLPKGVRRR